MAGITASIMREAMAQAQRKRYILGKMEEVISEGRAKISDFAPRFYTVQIPTDKIRDLIGPGGKMIRSIVEQTGVKIDVEDSGLVKVASAIRHRRRRFSSGDLRAGPGRHRRRRPRLRLPDQPARRLLRSRGRPGDHAEAAIINTRDEPHADPEKYRRLHVIIGDANLSEVSTYLKVGTTALVLAMIEDKFLGTDLSVEAPVAELRAISHDPTCRRLLTLKDGRKMTAVQLQAEYLELARKFTEDKYGNDVDDITADVLDRWESVLNRLADDPMLLSKELDWVAKLELLEGYRTRDGLSWDNPRLQLVDLQYSDVRQDRGLYNRLAARGRMVRLTDDATVERAIENPPEDTRAYFRGRCLRQYPESVAAASWDSVIFDIPGRESLQRVPTLEPLRGTRAHVGELLDRCRNAAELVAALTGQD